MRPRAFIRGLAACIALIGSFTAGSALAQGSSHGQYLIVLDDSGSMDRTDPERLVVMAALGLVAALEDGDQVMLVGLNELASGEVSGPTFVSPRELLEGRDGEEGPVSLAHERVARVGQHRGATPCREALDRSRAILNQMASAGAPQTLLMLTDGACNAGALEPAERYLGELRAHADGRFRFVLLSYDGPHRERVDPVLEALGRATGWGGETRVPFDARSLMRAFAQVLSFTRGLRYDDGGRVGLERTFAGARSVRVLSMHPEGTDRIALEEIRAGGSGPLSGGPTFRHPEHGWALRVAVAEPSELPFAVRSATPGAEVLVIPIYGRLRVEALVLPCGEETPPPPWERERSVRAGQPACAHARLVGDVGQTVHPNGSFPFALEVCRDEACAEASVMQPAVDGTFHAQLGAELPLGRHERIIRARGDGLAGAITTRRAFSAVAFGVQRVVREGAGDAAIAEVAITEVAITEVALGVLPKPVADEVRLRVSGSFPANARARVGCEVDADEAISSCVRCEVGTEELELTDPFTLQLTIRGTAYCPAVSEGDGRALPVRLRAVLTPDTDEVGRHVIPLSAELRYAPAEPIELSVEGGSRAEARLSIPAPAAQEEVEAEAAIEGDLEAGLTGAARLRAGDDGLAEATLFAEAAECCRPRTYEGTLTLSAASGGPSLTLPLRVEVRDPGFWVCPGQQILRWALGILALCLLIFTVHGFVSPATFRKGANLTWAESHDALLRIRDGDEGWRPIERFGETKRGFRRPGALHLGGPRAPLPSLARLPTDGRIEATPGGGATLLVTGPGVERFEESNGWVELSPGTYPVPNRITLRRGEEVYLQFRR